MHWQPTGYALISLLGASVPAAVGAYAWRWRGKPGGGALAVLLWLLALWGVAYSVELGGQDVATVVAAHKAGIVALSFAALFWLVFVFRYTGREQRWLRWAVVAVLAAVPVATLALILTGRDAGLLWTFTGVVDAGAFRTPVVSHGPLFWAGFGYATFLVAWGAALLIVMLVDSRTLYARQSLCLLLGFVGPWVVYTAHLTGLDEGLGALPGLDPTVLAFAPAGLALAWGFYRHGLLDISPVAHGAIVEGMSDGTLVLDARGRITDLNPSAVRILGCKPGEAVGQSFREVVSRKAAPLEGNRASALLRRYEEQGRAHEEITLGRGDEARHYDLALSALYDGRGKHAGQIVVLHEITERKLAVERLDRMAHYDALTGLANRSLFYERLNQEIARKKRTLPGNDLLALMFLDLDRFKMINDTLGHDVGDLLLKETARRLEESVRPYDVVARLAGDEFTVLLPELDGAASAAGVASRIVESIARPYLIDNNELLITTSVGICFYPADGHEPETLVKNADAAMYRAKAAGKNRYEIFAKDTLQNPVRHLELESELNHAVEEDHFVLHYQPEMRISTSRVTGMEALIRWEHPERGLVLPKSFIPVAEETGLIFAIERWVLREACRQMCRWQDRYPTGAPLTTSVSISPRHFAHPNFAGMVHDILDETSLPPETLVLEIKERALNEDAISAAVTLGALKKLGVRLAVDDFGAGYSSLQQLRRFPLDMLKIDASFVRALHESAEDREVVSAIVSLAHSFDLEVVAKGVENPSQLMRLKSMGCEIAQGDYFASSLSHRETSAFLVADLYY